MLLNYIIKALIIKLVKRMSSKKDSYSNFPLKNVNKLSCKGFRFLQLLIK